MEERNENRTIKQDNEEKGAKQSEVEGQEASLVLTEEVVDRPVEVEGKSVSSQIKEVDANSNVLTTTNGVGVPDTVASSSEEQITEVLMDDESEEELGAELGAAFNCFKTQLRAHFSISYKKIEARSLQSIMDCQRYVTSLLGTVHNQRLAHLEQFQNTVVQQLECFEQDSLSLNSLSTIEKETVDFWQSESDTVRAFCDRQQKR
ncbi:Synaptonemal complex protein 2-like [Anabarilius grahami]|uniref:Synaptonemal complex protein 2-like n=1 Tax=Anabarilius grahami TaxID=495550 RepID=A0A3N0YYD1_ANAGA|nr:Synaptonemal complex protein 2-like [Anabarilius grahami]